MNTLAQSSIFDLVGPATIEPPKESFSGAVVRMDPSQERKYPPEFAKTQKQLIRIFGVMCDGEWRTKKTIATLAKVTEHGLSARLSELDLKYGLPHEKKPMKNGLNKYRLSVPAPTDAN